MTKQEKIDRFLLRLRQELLKDENENILSILDEPKRYLFKEGCALMSCLWRMNDSEFENIQRAWKKQ